MRPFNEQERGMKTKSAAKPCIEKKLEMAAVQSQITLLMWPASFT